MPNVNLELVEIGKMYTVVELAELWQYKSYHALVKGVVTVSGCNTLILFVTKDKQTGATPYRDELKGNLLYMMGQEKHGTDRRLVQNLNCPQDDIYLFFRNKHHTPFTFYGKCFLISAELKVDTPSQFVFLLQEIDKDQQNEETLIDYFVNAPQIDGESISFIIEGTKSIIQHVRYERNPKNRKEAIRIQGHTCKICGFDFDIDYGKELAEEYIEVHHIERLSEGSRAVDPSRDLLPVCANCHRMLHRRRKSNMGVEELKNKPSVLQYSDFMKKWLFGGDNG